MEKSNTTRRTAQETTLEGEIDRLREQLAALQAEHDVMAFIRCQPWRAKRRLVVPGSREAALLTRRALRQRGSKVGIRV
ncbi:MAG: hypothetical protein JMN26_18210, partial [gamma proteobacterium endosymbiont of Lamellibrachia anaximandri]|nr:hypothetical protein [gamma proteobacterium endosymbiont of Lamellibrachia anaximandri]